MNKTTKKSVTSECLPPFHAGTQNPVKYDTASTICPYISMPCKTNITTHEIYKRLIRPSVEAANF